MKKITDKHIEAFKRYLWEEERAAATVEKYARDVRVFAAHMNGKAVDKAAVLAYKEQLLGRCAPASVNSVLSSLNSFFEFAQWHDCRVKMLKIQRQVFAESEKELTKAEYERLVQTAQERGNERLSLLMQTVCATGIRISELRYITCDAVREQQAVINCKGKMRVVILPRQLCAMLKEYMAKRGITSGSVFRSKNGAPMDRSNIWKMIKKLCEYANVPKEKVFPHNLRHLFARTYYSQEKDVVRLADVLGHSSINTTRIYTKESGTVHRKQIQKLGLLID